MRIVHLSREELNQIRERIVVQNPVTHRWVKGKGFSLAELREAGFPITLAKKIGLPIDRRRKSLHGSNVDFLRSIIIEKLGQKVTQVKVEAQEEAKEKPTSTAKTITMEGAIDAVVGAIVEFLDGANRRKKRKIVEIFAKEVEEKLPALASRGREELMSIIEQLLDDLSMAGLGKLSKEFFTKTKDWDVSTAREIMVESLKRILGE